MVILSVGKSSWNISVPTNEFIKEGMVNNYKESYASGAGMASNVAYLLSKWGANAVLSSMVGSDDYGTKLKREFTDLSAKTDYIETTYDKETSLDITLVNTQNKSKTVINVSTELSLIKKYNFEFQADIVFTDCFDYGASQNAFTKYPGAITIVGASLSTPEVLEMCKYSKYIICNREFAETNTGIKIDISNPQSLVDAYNKLQNKYPKAIIILSLDINGAVYQSGNQIKIMPGLNVEVVDRTGAGDAFKAAFIYCLTNNFDMDKSIVMSNIAAGLTVTKMGSRVSFPSLSEVINTYNQKMGLVADPNAQTAQPAPAEQQVQPQPQVQASEQANTQSVPEQPVQGQVPPVQTPPAGQS